jgi:hypothetical protein
MNAVISELVAEAINILSQNWERCDKDTGDECKGAQCDFVEHRVMAILDEISAVNKK